MALELIKINATATTTTSTDPNNTRFFYTTTSDTAAGTTLTIDAGDFFQDDGSAVSELPALNTDNSYYNVYINGALQMDDLSTYTAGTTGTGTLDIDVPAGGEDILANTPIALEVVNYNPNSTTNVTT